MSPPGIVNELSIRRGLADNFDVGLRYSGISWRLDTKYRFHHSGDGAEVSENKRRSFDIASGLAGARHSFKSPVFDVLEIVKINDFSRWDLEVPLYISRTLATSSASMPHPSTSTARPTSTSSSSTMPSRARTSRALT